MDAVPDPEAPLGRQDATRRWRLRDAGGWEGFPGVTTVEADRVGPALGALPAAERATRLVAVELGVVLSDGAGPYLLAADGALVLALGAHGSLPGASVAMGPGAPGRHRVGVARPEGPGLWVWDAVAEPADARRVAALDALAAVEAPAGLGGWVRDWDTPAG